MIPEDVLALVNDQHEQVKKTLSKIVARLAAVEADREKAKAPTAPQPVPKTSIASPKV